MSFDSSAPTSSSSGEVPDHLSFDERVMEAEEDDRHVFDAPFFAGPSVTLASPRRVTTNQEKRKCWLSFNVRCETIVQNVRHILDGESVTI